MVDVEEGALGTLGEDDLVLPQGLLEVEGGVGDIRIDLLVELFVFRRDPVGVEFPP